MYACKTIVCMHAGLMSSHCNPLVLLFIETLNEVSISVACVAKDTLFLRNTKESGTLW